MIIGLHFEIPNRYGRFLGDLLKPFHVEKYRWWIGGEEAYLVVNDTLDEPLFPDRVECMEGTTLKGIIENQDYYLIFQDMKAFPNNRQPVEIRTYTDFLNSDCELALLVIDSCYIAMYCKDMEIIQRLYMNAEQHGYINLDYITEENDSRKRLSVF